MAVTHTRTHTFNGPFSGTTRVSRYQKGKTNLDFTDARDSEWQWHRPVWARGRCRISPPCFLAECCKRQLNQVSFVVLYFRLSTYSDLYWVCLSVFSCTVLFVSISQVIGCEDRLRNDLYCVEWGVKLYSIHPPKNYLVPASITSGVQHLRPISHVELRYLFTKTYTCLHRKLREIPCLFSFLL